MFTGIVESTGTILQTEVSGENRIFQIASSISQELSIDQSVSHNGVCLTVEGMEGGTHFVTAVQETLRKTALGDWKKGDTVNLERSIRAGDRLDGHIVQGHVDATGNCQEIREAGGSHEIRFGYPPAFAPLIIEKGSVCVDGVSLTAFNVGTDYFSVAIIPYTFTHTNLSGLKPGSPVNLEFDIIGKYAQRLFQTGYLSQSKEASRHE